MKLVQINVGDRAGERFNGLAAHHALAAAGVDSTHLVWDRTTDAPHVGTLLPYSGVRRFNDLANRLEERWSLKAMLQAQAFALPAQAAFRDADLVHYQIIQDGFFSLQALPLLTRLKPSVWTWHDPWPMTGHCLHPIDCPGWLRGCGDCPDLARYYPMREDRTALNARLKKGVYARSRFDVIVASRWMADMAARSPVAEHLNVHVVPFGIDPAVYRPREKAAAREALGIEPGRVVLALRAKSGGFKGLADLKAMIADLPPDPPLAILAVDETGHFDDLLGGPHQVVDLGYVADGEGMAGALAAADLFLMPSHADAFGLMAVEAMACSLPVIVYQGTALPGVARAPDVGIAVPRGDVRALGEAVRRLIADPAERERRGALGRALVEEDYTEARHVERLIGVYEGVLGRRGRSAPRRPAIASPLRSPQAAATINAPTPATSTLASPCVLHGSDQLIVGHVGAVRREGVRQLLHLLGEIGWRLRGRAVRLHVFGEGFSRHGLPDGVLEVSEDEPYDRMGACDLVYIDAAAPAGEVAAAVTAALRAGRPLVVRGAGPRDVLARVGGVAVGLHAPGPQAATLFNAMDRLAADPALYARLTAGAAMADATMIDGWTPAVAATASAEPRGTPAAAARRLLQDLAAPRRTVLDLAAAVELRKHPIGDATAEGAALATGLDPWDYVAAFTLPPAAEARWLTVDVGSSEEVYLLLVDEGWAGVGERQVVRAGAKGRRLRFDLATAPGAKRLIVQAGPAPERGEVRFSAASLSSPL